MSALTWAAVMAWRMERQHLLDPAPPEAALDVVGALCGLHAQVMSSAGLSLRLRVRDVGPDDVGRRLWEERSLVKTWAMRGTLHLLPAREFGMWSAALGTLDHFRKPSWLRGFGITAQELDALLRAIPEALAGEPLTRSELAREVAARTGIARLAAQAGESWGVYLKPAAFQGELCFAPSAGRHVRFTRPDRWLGDTGPPWEPEAAVLEVVRRYLSAYGPARPEDLARWWAPTPARARRRLQAAGAVEVDVEGTRAWALPADAEGMATAAPPGAVRLLPAFDPYVAAANRGVPQLVAGGRWDLISRKAGWLSAVVLVDGRMDAVWRVERGAVVVEPVAGPPPGWALEALEPELARVEALLA